MERPLGVTTIAILFLAVAAYLAAIGVIILAAPNAVPLTIGAPLLHGLELAGPYMFLIAAAVAALVGWGLLRLINLARRAAALIAVVGIVLLIPKVSAESSDFSLRFFLAGAGIMVRVMIAWYLWQGRTAEEFHSLWKKKTTAASTADTQKD